MDQIWNNITSSDWMAIVSYIVQAICFILTCVILIQSKVNTIKLQAENQKLQQQAGLSEVEFRQKELAMREEYAKQLELIKKQIISSNQDAAEKKAAKQEAESMKIASNIEAASKSIDEIIHQ
jgi:hypothetical protein